MFSRQQTQRRGSSDGLKAAAPRRAASVVGGLAVALTALLIPARLHIIGYTPSMLRSPFRYGTEMLISACYDIAFVAVITAVTLALLWLAGAWRNGRRVIVGGFAGVAMLVLLAGLGNVRVVQMLDHPLNYAWLYYAEFLLSNEARSAIADSLSWRGAAIAGFALLVWLVGAAAATCVFRLVGRWVSAREAGCLIIPALVVYLVLSHWFLVSQRWNPAKLANPIWWFAWSVVDARQMPALLTLRTDAGSDDFQTVDERRKGAASGALPSTESQPPRPRNVVVFVLESTSSLWLDSFGGPYAVTPELSRYLDRGIAFDAAYANTPASPQSLVSLLCSAYPLLSYESLTSSDPDAPLPSISDTLRQRGYRTGFFSAGSIEFQRVDQFLQHRGFDVIAQPSTRDARLTSEWSYIGGSDEASTVASMTGWIDQAGHQPFFATYWSLQAHYPYFVTGGSEPHVTEDPELNRYLKAIRETDAAFGSLMRHLEERGLLDSTLVVVMGDHGESFGQHTNAKGRRLYEEHLRIPLAFIYGPRFQGERDAKLAAIIDVAPSILDLMGVPLPGAWQGRSLFGNERLDRVYFCAPWSDWLFGLREGDHKLILSATRGTREVYDLRQDPGEKQNVASTSPEIVSIGEQRLAAWAQYQRAYYARMRNLPRTADTATPRAAVQQSGTGGG